MLLPGERSAAFNSLLVPLIAQIPLLSIWFFAREQDKEKLQSHRYYGAVWKHWVPGVLIPSAAQWLYIILGAIIFESIEMNAEEDANSDFGNCLAGGYTRWQCREWEALPPNATTADADLAAMQAALGEAPGKPWRNFDFCGAAFFCFTLITTIGYGTFSPVTTGGKLFAIFYLVIGIPMNASLFAHVGETFIRLFFGFLVTHARTRARNRLGGSANADTDNSGTVSFDEVKAALVKGGLKPTDEQVMQLIADVDVSTDATLSYAKYERLLDKLVELAAQKCEAAVTAVVLLVSIILWAVFLPLSDPDTFGPVDGLYWSFITFSTVGLGDYVIDFSRDDGLNSSFNYAMFLAISIEMALLATMITSIFETLSSSRAILPKVTSLVKRATELADDAVASAAVVAVVP